MESEKNMNKRVEELEDKNFNLISENQGLRLKVYALNKMVSGLLEALNESEGMRKRKENEGLPRV